MTASRLRHRNNVSLFVRHGPFVLVTAMMLAVAACGSDAGSSDTSFIEPPQRSTAAVDAAALEPGAWHQLSSMSVPRSEAPAAALDGRIYFAGGLSTTGRTQAFDTLEVFDPATNDWSAAAAMPERRHHLMIASHDTAIYVFGGLSEREWAPQDNTWRYDPSLDTWTDEVDMPAAIGAGAAVTLGESIFVIAGTGRPQALYAFDPAESVWRELAALPKPLEHFAATTLAGQIYVSGGRWPGVGESRAVYRYDPASDTWSSVAPLNESRAGHAMAGAGSSLIVVGGELLGPRTSLDTVEFYDPATDEWHPGPAFPRPTHGVAAVGIDDVVYVVGGAPDAAQANALGEVYTLVP